VIRFRLASVIRTVALSALCVAVFVDIGQAQTIGGVVLDSSTRTPLSEARVELTDSLDAVVAHTVTDRQGRFTLSIPAMSVLVLKVSRPGYESYVHEDLRPSQWHVLELEVELAPARIPLPPVRVEARRQEERGRDQFERRRTGRGVFLDSAAIALREPTIATEALRDVPGIMLTPVPLTMNAYVQHNSSGGDAGSGETLSRWAIRSVRGHRCIAVFVDHSPTALFTSTERGGALRRSEVGALRGALSNPGSASLRGTTRPGYTWSPLGTLDELVQPDEIRAIEVYRQWAEVPEELRQGIRSSWLWPDDHLGPCGLVLVWTRTGW
jgi:hypothetical protein